MYNLNYIVAFSKLILGETSTSRDDIMRQHAIHGYRLLNFFSNDNVQVAYITPNDAYQCPFPVDYGYYTKIGVIIGGRTVTLTVNEELSLQNLYNACGELSISALSNAVLDECAIGGWMYAPHYRNGNYVGEMYGVTGGQNIHGYFKLYKEQRIIQFDPSFPKMTYVMEYVSNGATTTGSTIIPAAAIEPLKNYELWQLKEHDDRVPFNEKRSKQAQYEKSVVDLEHLLTCPTIDSWLDMCWSTIKSSPKR